MRFSIILPLYNKAPYVKKALESVCAQTWRDMELIVVDDGSTDGSAALVEQFLHTASDAPSYRIITQPNSGVAAARDKGVQQAGGEYVAFLDADDWWEPAFLATMAQLIEDYPDAGLYATNYIYYKPGKTHVAIRHIPTGYINYPKAYTENGAMVVFTSAAVMPAHIFMEMGGFPVGVRLGEDFLLWAKTALHYPVAFSDKPLVYYNNDVPATLRATRNLYAPGQHMLFLLEPVEQKIETLPTRGQRDEWQALLDMLRVSGLREYWLTETYHTVAAVELKKVDWSKQSRAIRRWYATPRPVLRLIRQLRQIGSYCKQSLIRLRLGH